MLKRLIAVAGAILAWRLLRPKEKVATWAIRDIEAARQRPPPAAR